MAFRPLAVVTGASTGIGFELARLCAEDGHDLVICADEAEIAQAAEQLKAHGGWVQPVQADLATTEGVDALVAALGNRPVDALLANAGTGLGGAFLDQDIATARHVIDTNITGTIDLIQRVGRAMRERNQGRILINGSIAAFIPGSFNAVYNGTKAFIDSFSWALRNELKDTEVTVTCLMPGATDTPFFARAGMEDTPVGKDEHKADPAKVARDGYKAMKDGDDGVVSGFMNKLQATFAGVIPDSVLAQMHRKMAEPERA